MKSKHTIFEPGKRYKSHDGATKVLCIQADPWSFTFVGMILKSKDSPIGLIFTDFSKSSFSYL